MSKSLILVVGLVLAAVVPFVSLAHSAPIVETFFSDTKDDFRWTFTWDLTPQTLIATRKPDQDKEPGAQWITPPPAAAFAPTFFAFPDRFFFSAQHSVPADSKDATFGDPFPVPFPFPPGAISPVFTVADVSAVSIGSTILFSGHVDHKPVHTDHYVIAYTKPTQGSLVTLEFIGVHDVPNASSLLLLVSGLTGLVFATRKRLNS